MTKFLAIILMVFTMMISCKSKKIEYNNDKVGPIDTRDVYTVLEKVDAGFAKKLKIEFYPIEVGGKYDTIDKFDNTSCYLEYKDHVLSIYSHSSQGYEIGLYTFIDQLGFKFYFPGDLWTIQPNTIDTRKVKNGIVSPKLLRADFFGGGGFAYGHPADPNDLVRKDWELWKKRNRFFGRFPSASHYWQAFISKNKATIVKNPSMVSATGNQLCVTNPKTQELFIQDRIDEIKSNINKYGNSSPLARAVSVEPNDGGGHCQCRECSKLGSISNQVYFLANKVAKAIKKDYPQVYVTLLAYNDHAEVPTIAIEDNIHVDVVPYAFQDVAAPDKIISDWVDKHSSVGIYDYWGTMIWSKAYPVKDYNYIANKKLSKWRDLGINSVMIESSYGIGEAGVPLYMLSKLAFDPSINYETHLNQLYTDLFGLSAGPIMKKMIDRWGNGVNIPLEHPQAYADFEQAKKVAETTLIKDRIIAFEDYFNMLLLHSNIEEAQPNTANRTQAVMDAIEYSYSIMQSKMLHSYWIPHPYITLYDAGRTDYTRYRADEYNKGVGYFKKLNPDTYKKKIKAPSSEILASIDNSSVSARSRTSHTYSRSTTASPRAIRTINSFEWYYTTDGYKEFVYDISLDKFPNDYNKGAINVSIYDESDRLISTKRYEHSKKYTSQKIELKKKGRYKIEFRISNGTMNLSWKDASGIELVPGTPVDFGAYAVISKGDKLLYSVLVPPKAIICVNQNITPTTTSKINELTCNSEEVIFEGGTVIDPIIKRDIYIK